MLYKSIGQTEKDLERSFVKNWQNSGRTDPIALGSKKKKTTLHVH